MFSVIICLLTFPECFLLWKYPSVRAIGGLLLRPLFIEKTKCDFTFGYVYLGTWNLGIDPTD